MNYSDALSIYQASLESDPRSLSPSERAMIESCNPTLDPEELDLYYNEVRVSGKYLVIGTEESDDSAYIYDPEAKTLYHLTETWAYPEIESKTF